MNSSILSPDLIVLNGNIITIDPKIPRAQALAVKDGRFVAIGDNEDIKGLKGHGSRVLDLGDKTVLPGFIDGHIHVINAAIRHALMFDCSTVNSIGEIQEELRLKALSTPFGEWVRGFKLDDMKVTEQRGLNREDLDQVSRDHPVIVNERSGLLYYANTKALERLGVTRDTPGEIAGYFDRDPDTGEPNGVLYEKAEELIKFHLFADATSEIRLAGLKKVCQMFASGGLTSLHDAMVTSDDVRTYQEAWEKGELPLRVYMIVKYNFFSGLKDTGIKTGFGDERLRFGGIKMVTDGALQARTAYLSKPYEYSDDYGLRTLDLEDIERQVMEVTEAGFQPCTHAMGDAAIDMVLTVYEKVSATYFRLDPRYRIEHCTLVRPDLLERMKSLGCVATPCGPLVAHHGDKMPFYGEERAQWIVAHRSFLDHNIVSTGASDYPSNPFEPLLGIQSCVTRTDSDGKVWGENQRISVEEALQLYTLHGAYASFEEDIKGSITPGKLADLVVLGQDPTTVDPCAIKDITVEMTMVGGEIVYES